jgi:hypothetical protein
MPDFRELSRSVAGLTVLVTGAASGMSRATARVFAAEGAQTVGRLMSLPARHPSCFETYFCEDGWMPGSSPGMTAVCAAGPAKR